MFSKYGTYYSLIFFTPIASAANFFFALKSAAYIENYNFNPCRKKGEH